MQDFTLIATIIFAYLTNNTMRLFLIIYQFVRTVILDACPTFIPTPHLKRTREKENENIIHLHIPSSHRAGELEQSEMSYLANCI